MAVSPVLMADVHSETPQRRALPAWVYNHPQMTRLEQERILAPSWQLVCHVNSIPKPGNFSTLDIGTEGIVALRDREGAIRAFHNVCRHRGARILDGNGSCPGTITCPYHGWSYRYDGSLMAVTERDSFPALDRAKHGLRPVRVEVFLGFVFVCLSDDTPPLAETWGELVEELAPYRLAEMVPLGPISYQPWEADWKLAMDNYLESYHVPIGHPGLNRMFTPDYEDQRGRTGVNRGISWLREQPSSKWSERLYQKLIVSTATHLPERERRSWRFYSMLPNLGLDIYPDQMDFFQVFPRGPGKCVLRTAMLGLADDRREMRVVRYLSNRINDQVNREDESLCTRVQRGLGSSSYQPGPLSRLEGWMYEFHELLRSRIPEARLPSAPTHFA